MRNHLLEKQTAVLASRGMIHIPGTVSLGSNTHDLNFRADIGGLLVLHDAFLGTSHRMNLLIY